MGIDFCDAINAIVPVQCNIWTIVVMVSVMSFIIYIIQIIQIRWWFDESLGKKKKKKKVYIWKNGI
jgi:hypothetical protein